MRFCHDKWFQQVNWKHTRKWSRRHQVSNLQAGLTLFKGCDHPRQSRRLRTTTRRRTKATSITYRTVKTSLQTFIAWTILRVKHSSFSKRVDFHSNDHLTWVTNHHNLQPLAIKTKVTWLKLEVETIQSSITLKVWATQRWTVSVSVSQTCTVVQTKSWITLQELTKRRSCTAWWTLVKIRSLHCTMCTAWATIWIKCRFYKWTPTETTRGVVPSTKCS